MATLAQLVAGAQSKATARVGGAWTSTEWEDAVNRAYEALWVDVLAVQPTLRVTTTTLTIASVAVPSQALPATFMNVLGVFKDANTSNRKRIPRYGDRQAGESFDRTFRIEGDAAGTTSMFIDPPELAPGAYEVKYNALPVALSAGVPMDAEFSQHRDYVELLAAISYLDAEESPSAALRDRFVLAQNRAKTWASRQRSSEPSRIRDVRRRRVILGRGL